MPGQILRALAGSVFAVVLGAAALAEETAPSIDKLAQQLASPDREARREAALQLKRSGTAAKPALTALIKAINDEDKQVATSALAAIAALGPQAQEAIPALLAALDTRKSRGRDRRQLVMRSAYALSRIGPAAVPPLIDAVGQDDTGLRIGGAQALGGLGKQARDAVPALIRILPDDRDPIHEEVIAALGSIGSDAGPALVAALGDGDARRRSGAALALAQIEPAFREAGAPIEKQLARETDVTVRAALFAALPKVGVAPDRCVALLLPGTTDDNEALRHAALNALLGTRAICAAAVPKLAALLRDKNLAVRERAARALGRMGPDAAGSLPALLAATRAADGAPAFADAIAQVGPAAVPALVRMLANANERDEALCALQAIGVSNVPELVKMLAINDLRVRNFACEALGALGPEAKDAAPKLRELAMRDGTVCEAAEAAMVKIEMSSEPAR